LFKSFIKFNVDILKQVSAASCAVQVKYSFPYSYFQLASSYQQPNITKPLKYSLEYHKKKVEGYVFHDHKARREIDNNVTVNDYNIMKNVFENSVCYICN
jgi:hypothetical protein